ncbi:glucose-1-phosphate cytidylyltransferase [Bosea sp. 2KB_26]|uniref:glucose-1-phosphate cytidylyltransferase n=1 Tax=Bosea sp. 2KB_26 TaxID=3237475 RepID=UPI000DE44C29
MKVVILAGGFGTRLSEETDIRPKPLVEIGGKPILWHIMKIYAAAGLTDFIICCGYKGQMIKNYFVNYFTENYDITVDLGSNSVDFIGNPSEKWKVTLIDTGPMTMTGGRLKRVSHLLGGETFCMTYGDGVADIDIKRVIAHHRAEGRQATVTAVPSPGRFGVLELGGGVVSEFREKPANEMGWINGGFFVLEPETIDLIANDATTWEREPLEQLAAKDQLAAYRHTGFWRPMDTLRDKRELEQMWATEAAPWKLW